VSPETLISVVKRVTASKVLAEIAVDINTSVPMRHKYIPIEAQIVGAHRVDPSRKPRTNSRPTVLPEFK